MALITIAENKRLLVVIVSVLAVLAALVGIWRSIQRFHRGPRTPRFEALGDVTAQETDRLLGHQGRIVVVDIGPRRANLASFGLQLTSFQKTLKRCGAITIVAVEPQDPKITTYNHGTVGFPAELLLKILATHPNLDAVVSFVGLPEFTNENPPPERMPKLIVVSGFNPKLKTLLRERVVAVAVVPRFTPLKETSHAPDSLREWFDLYYQVVTPETAAALPD